MDPENTPRGIASKLNIGKADSRVVDSSNGSKLQIELTDRLVLINDVSHPDFFFKAQVRGNGNLRFEVRSKDEKGTHHPDLYARDLYETAIKHFDSLGVNTSRVSSVWTHEEGLSDNFTAYKEADAGSTQKKDKAIKTPEGKVLSDLGYEPVSIEDNDPNEVIVQWAKKTQ
jgi:hypothetical protein